MTVQLLLLLSPLLPADFMRLMYPRCSKQTKEKLRSNSFTNISTKILDKMLATFLLKTNKMNVGLSQEFKIILC